MDELSEETRLLLLLLPLVVIELGGRVAALVTLARSERDDVRGHSRVLWAIVIIAVSFFGWIAWFLVGRKRA